jgi:hypothetical protein
MYFFLVIKTLDPDLRISAIITAVTGSSSNFQFCGIILIESGAGFGLLMNPDPTQIQILVDQKLKH